MHTRFRLSFFTGIIYIVSAVFGLIFSAGGLVALWTTRAEVVQSLSGTVAIFGRALDTTSQTIDLINGSLNVASENLSGGHAVLVSIAQSLDDSQGLIGATAGLVGTDLAGFFTQTQDSLAAVETSAQTVDQALGVIEGIRDALSGLRSIIPFFAPPAAGTNLPRATLQQSVAEVRSSLDPVPASLGEIERQLSVTAANVAIMRSELARLAEQVTEIEKGLDGARQVAAEYRAVLDDLQRRFDRFEEGLPFILRGIYLGLTLLLGWVFINQAGMLAHGIALVRGGESVLPSNNAPSGMPAESQAADNPPGPAGKTGG